MGGVESLTLSEDAVLVVDVVVVVDGDILGRSEDGLEPLVRTAALLLAVFCFLVSCFLLSAALIGQSGAAQFICPLKGKTFSAALERLD